MKRRSFGQIYKRKIGGKEQKTWTVRYRRQGRQVMKGGFKSKRDAESCLARVQAKLSKAEATGVRPIPRVAFKDRLPAYLQHLQSIHTAETFHVERLKFLGVLVPYFGEMAICDIRPRDIQRFVDGRLRGQNPRRTDKTGGFQKRGRRMAVNATTIKKDLAHLSRFFKHAIAEGFCRENPVRDIRRPKIEEKPIPFLHQADVDRLVEAQDDDLKPFVRLLSETGLRLGEALRLRWSDFDLLRGVLTVRRSKSGKPRDVPLSSPARAAIEDLGREATGAALLFPGIAVEGPERRITRFQKAAERAGLPKLRFHDLRHHLATALFRAGCPAQDIQRILGHQDLRTTLRYAGHAPENAAQLAIERLDASRGLTAVVRGADKDAAA
jgi:integrase